MESDDERARRRVKNIEKIARFLGKICRACDCRKNNYGHRAGQASVLFEVGSWNGGTKVYLFFATPHHKRESTEFGEDGRRHGKSSSLVSEQPKV
jgi:hypothetical protein